MKRKGGRDRREGAKRGDSPKIVIQFVLDKSLLPIFWVLGTQVPAEYYTGAAGESSALQLHLQARQHRIFMRAKMSCTALTPNIAN